MLESRTRGAADCLPTTWVPPRIVSHSLPTPCRTHPTSTRFPRERDTPREQPLPTASSTWTLVSAEVPMDGNTEPLQGPSKQDTLDRGKPPDSPERPPMPTIGVEARSHTPAEELLLGSFFPSRPARGLPVGDGRRVSNPFVNAPASWFFLLMYVKRGFHIVQETLLS